MAENNKLVKKIKYTLRKQKMNILQISKPTKQQVVNSIERVLGVFLVAFSGYLLVTKDPTSKASLYAAGLAGLTACYQALKSLATSL